MTDNTNNALSFLASLFFADQPPFGFDPVALFALAFGFALFLAVFATPKGRKFFGSFFAAFFAAFAAFFRRFFAGFFNDAGTRTDRRFTFFHRFFAGFKGAFESLAAFVARFFGFRAFAQAADGPVTGFGGVSNFGGSNDFRADGSETAPLAQKESAPSPFPARRIALGQAD